MFGKQQDGQSIIDKAVGAFQGVVEELDKGIAICNAEESDLDDEINRISERKAQVSNSRSKAVRVKNNIEQILR